MLRPRIILGALTLRVLSHSCGSSKTPPATCEELQQEINACANVSQEDKDSFGAFCATLGDACRYCFKGQLCTDECTRMCPRADAGSQGVAPVDAGPKAPSCAVLTTQLNGCPSLPEIGKGFESFCPSASEACRTCLDDRMCDLSSPCSSPCGK